LTYLLRLEMVQDITQRGLTATEAGAKHGVSAVTARKWHGRYLADGAAALAPRCASSTPGCERRCWP
jgi:transposase